MAEPDNDPNAEQESRPPAPLPHVGDPNVLSRRNVTVPRQTSPNTLDPRTPSAPVPVKPPVTGPAPEPKP